MMYYYLDIESYGNTERHIFTCLPDGGAQSFPLTPDNPNTVKYEEWLAEGNEPQPWPPAEDGE